MNRLGAAAGCLGLVSLLSLAGGCSREKARHEITGKVTYKGEPVEDGLIHFEPVEGKGSADGAQITNGTYRIPTDKGMFPGKYVVSIYIGDGYGGAGDASPDAPARPGRRAGARGKERAPPEFNTKSNLVRVVTAEGPNKFDFEIP